MKTREKEQGGKNRPPNTKEDNDTDNTLDLGNSESDETGLDPAEHTGENGAAVESKGKTDDNQDMKDTSQGLPGTTQGEPSEMVPSAETRAQQESDSLKQKAEEGQVTTPDTPEKTSTKMLSENGSTNQLTTDSPGLPGTTQGEPSEMVPSAETRVQRESDSLKEKAEEGQVTTPDTLEKTSTVGQVRTPDTPEKTSTVGLPGTTQGEPSEMVPSAETRVQQESDSLKEKAEEGQVTTPDTPEKTSTVGLPGTTQGEPSEMVPSAETRVQQESDSLKEKAEEGQVTTPDTPVKTSTVGQVRTPDTPEKTSTVEVQMSNDQTPAATNTPIITSEETVGMNMDASRSEGTGSSSEPQATEHDDGASQREGGEERHEAVTNTSGDNPALAAENEQSGSENLQSESGSSAPGHEGGKGEETEAQNRDANGRSEEKMKTGSGANKDDPKEDGQKEEKAKEEGVKGKGGTEDGVKTEERVVKERSVSISLCTSAYSFNVEGLVSYLNRLMKKYPELIKEVKFHELPYNDLDNYRFDEKDPVDVMILCHSINNRRFAITDVMDALYDEYLPYCARVVGKEKMGVIVHDFDDMRETVQSSRMSSFKYKQPKAFETTSLQITCGHIEKEGQILKQMLKEDRQRLFEFLKMASNHPEKIMNQRDIETKRQKAERIVKKAGDSVSSFFSSLTGSNEAQRSSTQQAVAVSPKYSASNVDTGETKPDEKLPDGRKNNNSPPTKRARDDESQPSPSNAKRKDLLRSDPSGDVAQVRQQSHADFSSRSSSASGSVVTSAPQRSLPQPTRLTEPRSTSVSICSSAYQHNVKGLLSWFTKFQAKQPHMINDVRFRSLPYNDIDSFRFPPDDPVDVMVLCHSVNNRGFSITNVLNALYEKYLKYCHDVIGKKKLAVIVHDFTDLKPSTVKSRMESFRRSQPLTFDFVDTAIVCGSLEDPAQLDMTEEDKTGLICFLERARLVPEENTELKQSVVGRLKNFFFD